MHEMLFRSMNMHKFVFGSGCVHKVTGMLAGIFFFKITHPLKNQMVDPQKRIVLDWLIQLSSVIGQKKKNLRHLFATFSSTNQMPKQNQYSRVNFPARLPVFDLNLHLFCFQF